MEVDITEKANCKLLREWDYMDVFNLFDFLESIWCYSDWAITKEWIKDWNDKGNIYSFKISTGGMSDNEILISALLENDLFRMIYYYSWRRGGHYEFQVNPTSLDYKLVSEYCKEHKITRQAISQNKHLYNWIEITRNKKMIKRISVLTS